MLKNTYSVTINLDCLRAAKDAHLAVKMIPSLISIEIRVHLIDNGNNEIRGGGLERDASRDEK